MALWQTPGTRLLHALTLLAFYLHLVPPAKVQPHESMRLPTPPHLSQQGMGCLVLIKRVYFELPWEVALTSSNEQEQHSELAWY